MKGRIMKTVEKNICKEDILLEEGIEEYEEFLKSHYRCHYAQSKKWANIKCDWKNEIIVVRDEQP